MSLGSGRSVLLTGATGFLGPYVDAALSQAGWRIRAALRQPSPFAGETAIVGSIGAATDWRAALAGVDTVVHLAARAHRPPATQRVMHHDYKDTNTEGTLKLAREATIAGVRHFVFMSSIAVNGPTTDGRAPFLESDPPAPRSVYGETKAAAEEGLRAIAGGSDMAITIVRPPMIYGRNAKGSFRTLMRAISAGVPLPFAMVHNRRAFAAAENIASFIAFRLSDVTKGYETFIIADDEQISTAEFARLLAKALHRRALLFPVPTPLLKAALWAARKPELIESTIGSLELQTGKAHAAGWRPAVTLDQGLARAARSQSDD
jgi:UDP-glucose 4-epimerase